eukprot:1162801-Ditylum_brightwellii.AAC.1
MTAVPSLWQWQLFLAANGTTCKGNNTNGLVVPFLDWVHSQKQSQPPPQNKEGNTHDREAAEACACI